MASPLPSPPPQDGSKCRDCQSKRHLGWAPLWKAWLCGDCQSRRTENELRYRKAVTT